MLSAALILIGVTLVWDAPPNGELWYNLYRSEDGELTRVNAEPISDTTYYDEDLEPLVTYRYAATAENVYGESEYSNQIIYTYTLRGDANLDGQITVSDAVAIMRHIVGLAPLDGLALQAADANDDGNVTVSDVTAIHRHIAGIAELDGTVSVTGAVE